jgi:hypothetical protein
MMGRVTFQDDEVARLINDKFVATWKNVQPGYHVRKIDRHVYEQFSPVKDKKCESEDFAPKLASEVPNGTANENVVSLFCTVDGEIIHVVPGYWHVKDYVKEVGFAMDIAKALELAGDGGQTRKKAVSDKHQERLTKLESSDSALGSLVLDLVHKRMIKEPLRKAMEVDGVKDYALDPGQFPPQPIQKKMQELQRLVQLCQQHGKSVEAVAKIVQSFEPLMKAGKIKEAESILDEALKLLSNN